MGKIKKQEIDKFKNSLSSKLQKRTIGLELEFSNGDKELIKLPVGYQYTGNKFSGHFNTTTKEIRNSARYGGEINTKPISLNNYDISELDELNQSIWDSGGKLNWYIDTHIHLYIKDMDMSDIHKINDGIYLLGNLQKKVWHIGDWNDTPYAVPLMQKEIHSKVSKAQNISEVASVFVDGSQRGFHRPYISMAQIETIGTIEYRQFPGTTDMLEIWEYIKFSYRFIDYCINHSIKNIKKITTEKEFIKVFKIDSDKITKQMFPFIYASDHKDNTTNVGEMFKKTTPIYNVIKKAVGNKKVLMFGSFNFDLEQALKDTEIEIYTSNAYVHFIYDVINNDIDFKFPEEFEYLNYDKGTSKAEKVARVILLMQLSKKYKSKLFYDMRYVENTINEIDSVVRATTEKAAKLVKNVEGRVNVKYGGFNDMVKAQKDEIILYQYEEDSTIKSLHNKANKFFNCNIDRVVNDYSLITKFNNYIFVSRNKYLPYNKVYTDGRNLVYSDLINQSIHKITSRETKTLYYKELPKDYEITRKSEIKFIRATGSEIDYIRQKYLSKNIIMGSAIFNYLWFVDGYIIGGCMLDYPKRKVADGGVAWLKSDFVISSNVPKLSKLLIIAILSEEFKYEVSIRFKESISTLVTNVFTKKPVSMKYRGVFKLYTRENNKLIYTGETGKYNRLKVEVLDRYIKAVKK
jgi:hypothetical protein